MCYNAVLFTLLLSNGYKNERVEVSDIFVPFPGCSRIPKAQMYEMVACFRLQGLYRYFFFNYILNIIRIFRTLTPDIGKPFFLTKSWLTFAAAC